MCLSRCFIAPEVSKPVVSFLKPLPILCPELLRALGIIPGNDAGRQESPINNKKRVREDGSPGPSRRRPNVKIKSEELSGDARTQRMRALRVSQGVVYFLRVAPDGVCM